MRVGRIITFVLFLFLVVSCKNRYSIEETVKKLSGKKIEIDFSRTVRTDTVGVDSEVYPLGGVKLVFSFDDECVSCFNNQIAVCENYLDRFNNDNLSILCIVPFTKEKALEVAGDLNCHTNIYLVYNDDKYYEKRNHLEEYNSFFKSFLLGEDNKVILVGNPLRSPKLKTLFDKTIHDMEGETGNYDGKTE